MLKNIAFGSPTLFNPILQETIKIAKHSYESDDKAYYILLILTDG